MLPEVLSPSISFLLGHFSRCCVLSYGTEMLISQFDLGMGPDLPSGVTSLRTLVEMCSCPSFRDSLF